MPPQAQYKILSGTSSEVEHQLQVLNNTGSQPWKPLMMTSVMTPKGVRVDVLAAYELPAKPETKAAPRATVAAPPSAEAPQPVSVEHNMRDIPVESTGNNEWMK
jgi:hypothetical protein